MHKIVTYGLIEKYNLGCPSILMGFYSLLDKVFDGNFEMINLEFYTKNKPDNMDTPYKTYYVKSCSGLQMLQSIFLNKKIRGDGMGISFSDAVTIVKNADVVVNLYGICFCDKFSRTEHKKRLQWLFSIISFPLSYIAKKNHIKSVKNTASFGPIIYDNTKNLALFSNKHHFDYMIAREKKSLQEMQKIHADHNLLFDYDTANLMPYNSVELSKTTIGVSTSYQMVRQWRNPEDYTSCIANLCVYIEKKYNVAITLIPNDSNPAISYNDVSVSEDILYEIEKQGGHASILPVDTMTACDIKNYIASCECMVASRYHSCVAALSSGVPLLVVGWHYKYEELLEAYGQGRWLLSENNCDSEKLIKMFDQLWNDKEKCQKTIIEAKDKIIMHIYETGKKIYK